MQIKTGHIIRGLRRRDSRKQEDPANALGVTCQAVSRREANKGYPDIEMIPAIANFFHVSIDELFGYDGNLEKAMEYFDKGFNHHKTYKEIRKTDKYCYSSPLFSKVISYGSFPKISEDGLRDYLSAFAPENLRNEILRNEKYSECFEYLKNQDG